MYTIHLHNLSFFSYHGLHEEETILGGWFNVSIDISTKNSGIINSIQDTINYAEAYMLVKSIMNTPTPLLETIARDIVYAIYHMDNRINTIKVTIHKLNPPIAQFSGDVGVSYHKEF